MGVETALVLQREMASWCRKRAVQPAGQPVLRPAVQPVVHAYSSGVWLYSQGHSFRLFRVFAIFAMKEPGFCDSSRRLMRSSSRSRFHFARGASAESRGRVFPFSFTLSPGTM